VTGTSSRLSVADHPRDSLGLTYVYPVVSRRARGLSVGINLNSNNACNWRCIYCQVPGLTRGAPPPVNLLLLKRELTGFLEEVLRGRFMAERVPEGLRRINDVAFSGNGEPTSCRGFDRAVEVVIEAMQSAGVPAEAKVLLITNGSLIRRPAVRRGLEAMARRNGEMWFKLDGGTPVDWVRINDVRMTRERVLENLQAAAESCPTWVQTCVFRWDAEQPSIAWRTAYLEFLDEAQQRGARLQGVHLYSVARPSMQPEAPRLSQVSEDWGKALAKDIAARGIRATWNP
jgi:wyosine [tRNA(Phe)-imidazoG37] synthetase (radical SAM superfamily)